MRIRLETWWLQIRDTESFSKERQCLVIIIIIVMLSIARRYGHMHLAQVEQGTSGTIGIGLTPTGDSDGHEYRVSILKHVPFGLFSRINL